MYGIEIRGKAGYPPQHMDKYVFVGEIPGRIPSDRGDAVWVSYDNNCPPSQEDLVDMAVTLTGFMIYDSQLYINNIYDYSLAFLEEPEGITIK